MLRTFTARHIATQVPEAAASRRLRILTGGWPLAMAAAGGNRFRDRRVPGR